MEINFSYDIFAMNKTNKRKINGNFNNLQVYLPMFCASCYSWDNDHYWKTKGAVVMDTPLLT